MISQPNFSEFMLYQIISLLLDVAAGLLAASVFHFGKFQINEVKAALHAAGRPVRFS